MFPSSPYYSRIAAFLVVALATGTAAPGFAAPGRPSTDSGAARSAEGTVRIAVAPCGDRTAEPVEGLTTALQRSLRLALEDQGGFEVVPSEAGQAESLLKVDIAEVFAPDQGEAAVELSAQTLQPQSGRELHRGTVRGIAEPRPGEERLAQLYRAVDSAAQAVAAQVAQVTRLTAVIIETQRTGRASIDRGATDQVRVGCEFEVLHRDRAIGNLTIDKVSDSTAEGELSDVPEGLRVRTGDIARMTFLPPAPAEKPKKHRSKTALVIGGIILLGLLIAALSNRGHGETPPPDGGDGTTPSQGGVTLLVRTSAVSVPADSTEGITITATLVDGDNAPITSQREVRFATTRGIISPGRVNTQNGVAEAALTPTGASGPAVVRVTSEGLSQQVQVQFTSAATGGATEDDVMEMVADPSTIETGGSSQITVWLLNGSSSSALGTPLPDGTPVSFSMRLATGQVILGMVSPADTTTTGGMARATFTPVPPAGGRVTIIARSGELQDELDVVVGGSSQPDTGEGRVLTVLPDAGGIPANGTSTTSVVVLAALSGAPQANIPVTLSTTAGTLSTDGRHFAATAQRTTGNDGRATFVLRSVRTTELTWAQLTATANQYTSGSATVSFTVLKLVNLAVEGSAKVSVGGTERRVVTVAVIDSLGAPGPAGLDIEFAVVRDPVDANPLPGYRRADITPTAKTDNRGSARVQFTSGDVAGVVQIRASLEGVGEIVKDLITQASNQPAHVGIRIDDPERVAVMGSSDSEPLPLSAIIYDEFNNQVQERTTVYFAMRPGDPGVLTEDRVPTDASGLAETELHSTGLVGWVELWAWTWSKPPSGSSGGDQVESPHLTLHMAGAPASVEIASPPPGQVWTVLDSQATNPYENEVVIRVSDRDPLSGAPGPVHKDTQVSVSCGGVGSFRQRIAEFAGYTDTYTIFKMDHGASTPGAGEFIAEAGGAQSAPVAFSYVP